MSHLLPFFPTARETIQRFLCRVSSMSDLQSFHLKSIQDDHSGLNKSLHPTLLPSISVSLTSSVSVFVSLLPPPSLSLSCPLPPSLSLSLSHTHTHTHRDTFMFISLLHMCLRLAKPTSKGISSPFHLAQNWQQDFSPPRSPFSSLMNSEPDGHSPVSQHGFDWQGPLINLWRMKSSPGHRGSLAFNTHHTDHHYLLNRRQRKLDLLPSRPHYFQPDLNKEAMRCPSLSSKRYKCQLLKNASKRLFCVNGWVSLLKLRSGKCG